MESVLKMIGVESGTIPARPTTLLFGQVRDPPRLIILWYMTSLSGMRYFARMMVLIVLGKGE